MPKGSQEVPLPKESRPLILFRQLVNHRNLETREQLPLEATAEMAETEPREPLAEREERAVAVVMAAAEPEVLSF